MDEIIVSWNNVDGAAFYRLYKVDMSKVKKDEYGDYDGTDYSFDDDEQNVMFINFDEGTFPDGYILYSFLFSGNNRWYFQQFHQNGFHGINL